MGGARSYYTSEQMPVRPGALPVHALLSAVQIVAQNMGTHIYVRPRFFLRRASFDAIDVERDPCLFTWPWNTGPFDPSVSCVGGGGGPNKCQHLSRNRPYPPCGYTNAGTSIAAATCCGRSGTGRLDGRSSTTLCASAARCRHSAQRSVTVLAGDQLRGL